MGNHIITGFGRFCCTSVAGICSNVNWDPASLMILIFYFYLFGESVFDSNNLYNSSSLGDRMISVLRFSALPAGVLLV